MWPRPPGMDTGLRPWVLDVVVPGKLARAGPGNPDGGGPHAWQGHAGVKPLSVNVTGTGSVVTSATGIVLHVVSPGPGDDILAKQQRQHFRRRLRYPHARRSLGVGVDWGRSRPGRSAGASPGARISAWQSRTGLPMVARLAADHGSTTSASTPSSSTPTPPSPARSCWSTCPSPSRPPKNRNLTERIRLWGIPQGTTITRSLGVGGACGPPPPVAAPLVPRCALLPAATPRVRAAALRAGRMAPHVYRHMLGGVHGGWGPRWVGSTVASTRTMGWAAG